jgi:hypothetical protein
VSVRSRELAISTALQEVLVAFSLPSGLKASRPQASGSFNEHSKPQVDHRTHSSRPDPSAQLISCRHSIKPP